MQPTLGRGGCTSCWWQDAPVAAPLPPLYCLRGRRSSSSLVSFPNCHECRKWVGEPDCFTPLFRSAGFDWACTIREAPDKKDVPSNTIWPNSVPTPSSNIFFKTMSLGMDILTMTMIKDNPEMISDGNNRKFVNTTYIGSDAMHWNQFKWHHLMAKF